MVVFSFHGMRERGQLRMAYNFGWNGRMKAIANLYKSNKRRRETNKEEIGEKKKKKKMRMKRSSDIISSGNRNLLDDDILVYEILSRLPAKSLMRFKSVCKRWLSLIEHDSHFTQSETHPCLLYLLPLALKRRLYGIWECFFSADLGEGRASVSTISRTRSLAYNGILKPVNGLICFFSEKEHYVGVCIYNPGTREITPWIYSTLVMEDEKEIKFPTYGFGFDPATKEHKVICVWRRSQPTPLVACEILTVGQNKWRRIDEVPPYEFEKGSVYVNGSIYWSNKYWPCGLYKTKDDPEVIIAFDVGSEKFRTIAVPNFILNQLCDCKQYCCPHVDLLEVDGRVALLRRMDGYTVKLWIYFDDHNYDKKENITTTSDTNWSEETIKLPFCWDKNVRLSFHGVAGTNQLMLRSVELRWSDKPRWPVSLYSYNRKNQTFKNIEISGISSISDPDYSLFTPFVESLLSVSSSGTPTLRLDLGSESIQELRGPVSSAFPWN